MFLLSLAMLIQEPVPNPRTSSAEKCAPQPMPRAIDIGEVALASHKIEFAATPQLENPQGAWVIRLWRRGTVEANIEILKLRGQYNCNRYDVEKLWKSKITQEEYAAVASNVLTFGVPDRSAFDPQYNLSTISFDGTGVDLRLKASIWQVDLHSNLGDGRNAQNLSKVFHDLAARYVPQSDLPSKEWRGSLNSN
jgi:hypothetical protein